MTKIQKKSFGLSVERALVIKHYRDEEAKVSEVDDQWVLCPRCGATVEDQLSVCPECKRQLHWFSHKAPYFEEPATKHFERPFSQRLAEFPEGLDPDGDYGLSSV